MAETTKAKVTGSIYFIDRNLSRSLFLPTTIRRFPRTIDRLHLFIRLTVREDRIIYIDTLNTSLFRPEKYIEVIFV